MMDIDDIFDKIGQFERYQIQQYLLLSFPILFSSYHCVSYIFTTGNSIHRCRVPECEIGEVNKEEFDQPWLREAIPFNSHGFPEQCLQYEPIYSPDSFNISDHQNTCFPFIFNKEKIIRCNSWIFKDDESTIISEFTITCLENAWKIPLVGSMNYLGFFIGMPISGVFGDRYGRKKVLVISSFLQSVFAVMRSFSQSYESFLALQFLGAFFSGAYNAGFILGLEIVGPKKRVLGNAIMCCFHSAGEATVGLLMWVLKDWRLLSRYLFGPGLLIVIYLWIIPESIRWLLTKGKTKETLKIFTKMAEVNKRSLPPDFNDNWSQLSNDVKGNKNNDINEMPSDEIKKNCQPPCFSSLTDLIKSSKLLIRLGLCTICWMVTTMAFYGLSISSVSVTGNKYLNFILTVLVELPGYLSTWLLMDIVKVGRRHSLSISYLFTGLNCIAVSFISEIPSAKLVLFLLGKCSITFAYGVIYIYTAEMFPTGVRNSLLGICSMTGHIGSVLAPQTLLLSSYIESTFIWGVLSLVASLICVLFPETLNTKLPDTIEEAENIGLQ